GTRAGTEAHESQESVPARFRHRDRTRNRTGRWLYRTDG
ncbi:MAG: hypothetical protein RLZZ154_475, partial [Actinomycetota bacterium]